jgi:hypothetical protein
MTPYRLNYKGEVMKEKILDALSNVWFSYWTAAIVLATNVWCVFFTFTTQGANLMLLWNLVGFTFSLRIVYQIYKSRLDAKRMHAAFEIAMMTIQPKMNVIFRREHARHGLKEGQMLTQGQLLAIHDEMAELMAEAQEHYKSLVSESNSGKP